jgi:hypothetical protein
MTPTKTIRRTGAGAGIAALVASALMFAPAADAATAVNVTNADVKPTATDYVAWHQGYEENPTGAKVTAKGLELTGGKSQVIKGYANNDETITPGQPNFDIAKQITGSRFTATSGTASLQIPLRSSNVAATGNYTTLYSLTDQGSRVKTSDLWSSTKAIGTGSGAIPAFTPVPLTSIIAKLGDYKVIGFGVQAEINATISDITWDGVTYTFKEPASQVSKAKFYKFSPKSGKITTRDTVYAYVSVTVDGKQAPKGLALAGYAKGKKVVTGTVNGKGKAKLKLGKLPKGKSTLKVTVVGNDTVKPVSISRVVKVKK